MSVRHSWFIALFKSSVSLPMISSLIANKVLKSPTIIVKLFISLEFSFYFIYFGILLLGSSMLFSC